MGAGFQMPGPHVRVASTPAAAAMRLRMRPTPRVAA